jgi:ABC-type dipeptide/oligopeptide/nickel transport system permease component
MGIVRYVLRRLVALIPVVLGVTFITFFLSRVLVSNPARAWAGPRAPASAVAQIAASYHLNQPIPVQYVFYMRDILLGNWGNNPITGRTVLAEIGGYFPATLELALTAFLITIVLGIPLGVIAALRQDKKIDHGIRFFYLAGFSSPPFFVALILLIIFGYYSGLLPTQGELSPLLTPPTHITGLYVLDSLFTRNWADLQDSILHLILPAAALALTYFGLVVRVTRASMLEVSQKEFVKVSFAKGLTKRVVVTRHILRNALISTTTILGLILGAMLGGTVVIESIFLWPGIGFYAVQAIESFDYPAVMGVTFVFTLGVVIANLLADIVYAYLNPRIAL